VTADLSMMTMAKPGYSGPMVDGKTILGAPDDAIIAGLTAKVPVIVGANSADGMDFSGDKAKAFAGFGPDADAARAVYDPDGSRPGGR
jgi:para-nitrobenzyl esterase